MQSFSQFERIIWIHDKIKTQNFDRERYIHKFGVNERTLYRDIEKLKNRLDAPLVSDNGNYFYSDKTYELPMLLLSEEELFGMLVSTAVIEKYRDTPMYLSLKKIFERLENNLSGDVKYLYIDINKGNVKLREFNWEYLQDLIDAIYEHKLIRVNYHSFNQNKTTERILEPYHIYNYMGEFYLVAYCDKNRAFRDFFVGRIKSLKVLDNKFEQRNFNLDEYFNDRQWGIVKGGDVEKVRFKVSKEKSPWVVEKYGSRLEKIKKLKDGMVFEIETEVTIEFIDWVLSYGSDIKVLGPQGVIKEVENKCKEILKNYT